MLYKQKSSGSQERKWWLPSEIILILLATANNILNSVIVFILIFFVVTPTAQKLVYKIFNPGEVKSIFMISAMQCCTVCLIVPIITLIATFIHNGLTADWFTQWISLGFLCFPCALCVQMFFVGPFVRMIFRMIFRKQLEK